MKKSVHLAHAALYVALSIILGKFLSLTLGAFRISFENLPIILAGITLGPIYGAMVGCVADLVGCLLVGFTINPIITIGSTVIGLLAGLLAKKNLASAIYLPHLAGSVIIKSIGLWLYYAYPLATLAYRIPLYLIIASLEYFLIRIILPHIKNGRP